MSRVAEAVRNRNFPYITVCLIIVNVVMYFITAFSGNPSNAVYMLSRGADYAPYVFERHQYYRLISSMFLHFSFMHLASNMVYLGIVGWTYERVTGHWKFLLIYMFSGIGGNVISCAWHHLSGDPVVSAGASGAVYGTIAIVVYLSFIARKRTGAQQMFLRIGIMLIFMFYSNFASRDAVDVAAHLGGLVFGLLLCLLLLPYKKQKPKNQKGDDTNEEG